MKAAGFTHDSKDNKTVEWYTPEWVFDALGVEFDLDPCQPPQGVPWIPAKKFYSPVEDGLKQMWFGNVWLNPPYGRMTPVWLAHMNRHRHGIALLFARTDCQWFHDYVCNADAVLFLKGRVRFVDGEGVTKGSGAGSGSLLVAWGQDNVAALNNLKGRGFLVERRGTYGHDS